MKKSLLISIFCLLAVQLIAQQKLKTENVVLITLDGMRWQEVFNGAEKRLIVKKEFVDDTASLKKLFWN